MANNDDLAALGNAILVGIEKPTVDLRLEEFQKLYAYILKRADRDVATVTVAIADGATLAVFTALSRQVVCITDRGLGPKSFQWPSPARVNVSGGPRTSSWRLLMGDLRDAALACALIGIGLSLVFWAGFIGPLASALSPSLALASGVFFAVFVLFGVGEITGRGRLQAKVFKTGQLQRYLDADRYLVRLATWSFILALLTPAAAQALPGIGTRVHALYPDAWQGWSALPEAAILVLLWSASTASLLCLRAVGGYLIDRAAGTLLADLAEETIHPTRHPQNEATVPDRGRAPD